MPNTPNDQTLYVPTGNPDTWTEVALTRPGELGKRHDYNDRTYQRVKLDSGATASNTVGVVAANQLAYWKDKSNYIVTNDWRQAHGGAIGTNAFANFAAGIFRSAVTAGYYCDIVVRGRNIAVADDGNSLVGETAVPDTTANVARIATVNVGTAATYRPIGVIRTASAANVAYVDVDIPEIP